MITPVSQCLSKCNAAKIALPQGHEGACNCQDTPYQRLCRRLKMGFTQSFRCPLSPRSEMVEPFGGYLINIDRHQAMHRSRQGLRTKLSAYSLETKSAALMKGAMATCVRSTSHLCSKPIRWTLRIEGQWLCPRCRSTRWAGEWTCLVYKGQIKPPLRCGEMRLTERLSWEN